MKYLGAALLIALAATPAEACMLATAPEAMIFATEPTETPKDSLLLKGRVMTSPKGSWGFTINVLEGPKDLLNQQIWIEPARMTDCTGIGRDLGYLAVRKGPITDGKQVYTAEVYERSWYDWIFVFFGAEPYGAQGKHREPLV